MNNQNAVWRNLVGVLLAVGVVLSSALISASAASATGSKSGYIECRPTFVVRLSSTTTNAGKPAGVPMAVRHNASGAPMLSWSTSGVRDSRHNTPGGNWNISTTGTLVVSGVGCVK